MAKGTLVVIACCLLLGGCEDKISGIAFLHVTALDEACPPPEYEGHVDLDALAQLPYERAHAVAAYQGGSAWDGGDVIAIAWRDDDGTISRLFFDVGPARGFGISTPMPTDTLIWPESTGFVQWNGDERRFAAVSANGVFNYGKTGNPHDFRPGDTYEPGELYAHLAFDGIGPAGEPRCMVLGVHATPDRERVDPYDPSWLTPTPGVMFTGNSQPTFVGDVPPGDAPVAPALAGPDPGGPPPALEVHLPTTAVNGGDGSGGCD
jgi:hypothetical protein